MGSVYGNAQTETCTGACPRVCVPAGVRARARSRGGVGGGHSLISVSEARSADSGWREPVPEKRWAGLQKQKLRELPLRGRTRGRGGPGQETVVFRLKLWVLLSFHWLLLCCFA